MLHLITTGCHQSKFSLWSSSSSVSNCFLCCQATPDRKAKEVTCWLVQAYDELLEGWDSTEGESYSERYHVRYELLVNFIHTLSLTGWQHNHRNSLTSHIFMIIAFRLVAASSAEPCVFVLFDCQLCNRGTKYVTLSLPQVFHTFVVSFNEQRRPIMPLLTAMRRTPTLSEEQRALREAWGALSEKVSSTQSSLIQTVVFSHVRLVHLSKIFNIYRKVMWTDWDMPSVFSFSFVNIKSSWTWVSRPPWTRWLAGCWNQRVLWPRRWATHRTTAEPLTKPGRNRSCSKWICFQLYLYWTLVYALT